MVLVFGASVNHWTTKHGALIAPSAKVVQIDIDARAIGRNRPADVAIARRRQGQRAGADRRAPAPQPRQHGFPDPRAGRARSPPGAGADEPYEDAGTDEWIDPRTLTIALNELLPANRMVAVDSGHFTRLPVDVPRRPRRRARGCSPTASRRSASGWATRSAPRSPARTAHGRGDRRRRRVHGAGRDRDRGPAEARRCSS